VTRKKLTVGDAYGVDCCGVVRRSCRTVCPSRVRRTPAVPPPPHPPPTPLAAAGRGSTRDM